MQRPVDVSLLFTLYLASIETLPEIATGHILHLDLSRQLKLFVQLPRERTILTSCALFVAIHSRSIGVVWGFS